MTLVVILVNLLQLSLLQAAWNGSVSHNWGNRITRYRDTITEDSPALVNGAVNVFRTDNVQVNEYTNPTTLVIHFKQLHSIKKSLFSFAKKGKKQCGKAV